MAIRDKLMAIKNDPQVRGEIIRYLCVGVGCAALEFGLFALCDQVFHFVIPLSNFISQGTAFVINFLLTHFWTFKVEGSAKALARNVLFYGILFVFNNIVTSTAITFLVRAGVPSLLAKLLMMGLVVIWNFVIYRTIIFKRTSENE